MGAVHIPQSSRVARAHLALIAELKVALVPFRLFVVEGFFAAALFVVPERLVGCDLDDVEPGFGCLARVVEDDVDLFEAAEAGLWVEVVDDGDDDEVEDREDDVGAVADVVEGDRGNLHDGVVDEPVGCCAHGVCWAADAEGDEFDLQEPGDSLESAGEEGDV